MQDRTIARIKGPVLIAANHPNSFLDAIIIATIFDRPIHFLARGDAFHKPWHNFILRSLHMFPIYRLREGKEYLGLNAAAFENSRKVLSQHGIVLIFIEGICVNKHELQPFKKGAARIASNCWKEGIPLQILPLGIGYSSFDKMGKSVLIKTGQLLEQKQLMYLDEEAKNYVLFNQILFQKIQALITIPEFKPKSVWPIKILGRVGNILHQPLYQILSGFVRKKTRNTVFYDSVLFGLLFFSYPIYLILLGLFLSILSIPLVIVLLIILVHPILAYFATSTKIHTKS
jgi:1-acyl-sn-glycerol-3-phosphate acyltransferase